MEMAEAFPADRFETRPAAAVRTFGEVLRHVAFWHQYVADSLRGKQPDGAANELALAACPTKASMLEALRRGSEDVTRALGERQDPADSKTAELLLSFIEHTSEHYGQLVVYGRLQGVVPPASRG